MSLTFLPEIQSELINIVEKDLILNGIICDTKDPKLFSIMADKMASHNIEVLAFFIRFINGDINASEEFIDFVPLIRITREGSYCYKANFKKLGFHLANTRGYGYDK